MGGTGSSLKKTLRDNQPAQIYEPNTVAAYSNFGAALAGFIVERISGEDFANYVLHNIFVPLGIEHTAVRPDYSDNAWVAQTRANERCYSNVGGKLRDIGVKLGYIAMYPAGSACGTPEDFAKYVSALIPGDEKCVLFENADTLAQLYTPTLYYADGTPRIEHVNSS